MRLIPETLYRILFLAINIAGQISALKHILIAREISIDLPGNRTGNLYHLIDSWQSPKNIEDMFCD